MKAISEGKVAVGGEREKEGGNSSLRQSVSSQLNYYLFFFFCGGRGGGVGVQKEGGEFSFGLARFPARNGAKNRFCSVSS